MRFVFANLLIGFKYCRVLLIGFVESFDYHCYHQVGGIVRRRRRTIDAPLSFILFSSVSDHQKRGIAVNYRHHYHHHHQSLSLSSRKISSYGKLNGNCEEDNGLISGGNSSLCRRSFSTKALNSVVVGTGNYSRDSWLVEESRGKKVIIMAKLAKTRIVMLDGIPYYRSERAEIHIYLMG